jgi:hypothetical protein
MAQQTAVEWLMDKLYDPSYDIKLQIKYFEQAKQINKEQTKAAYNQGYRDGENGCIDPTELDISNYANAEVYYNETYGK